MKEEREAIVCDVCGAKATREVKRPQVLGRGAQMILVDNVPIVACRNCGESYMTGHTIHQLDKLRSMKKASARKIGVAEFVYD